MITANEIRKIRRERLLMAKSYYYYYLKERLKTCAPHNIRDNERLLNQAENKVFHLHVDYIMNKYSDESVIQRWETENTIEDEY